MTIGEYFGKDFPGFYKECRYSLQREGMEITSFSLKDYQTRPITKAIIDYYKNTKIKRYSFQVGKKGKVINFTFVI